MAQHKTKMIGLKNNWLQQEQQVDVIHNHIYSGWNMQFVVVILTVIYQAHEPTRAWAGGSTQKCLERGYNQTAMSNCRKLTKIWLSWCGENNSLTREEWGLHSKKKTAKSTPNWQWNYPKIQQMKMGSAIQVKINRSTLLIDPQSLWSRYNRGTSWWHITMSRKQVARNVDAGCGIFSCTYLWWNLLSQCEKLANFTSCTHIITDQDKSWAQILALEKCSDRLGDPFTDPRGWWSIK